MRSSIITCVAIFSTATVANAADVDAGKAKVQTVCAACHGVSGVSVSDRIPNLAAQKAAYLEAQLRALKDGSRKNAIMNAIAVQLSSDDIANVAAYFATQPGAPAAAKSDLLPNLAKTSVSFPENFKATFVKYHSINNTTAGQIQLFLRERGRVAGSPGGNASARRFGASGGGLFGEAGRRQEARHGCRRLLRA